MSSNVINLLTNDQLLYLKELDQILLSVHLDKYKSYKMATINADGRHEYYVNREEYLEFIISVIVEELGVVFPQLEDIN